MSAGPDHQLIVVGSSPGGAAAITSWRPHSARSSAPLAIVTALPIDVRGRRGFAAADRGIYLPRARLFSLVRQRDANAKQRDADRDATRLNSRNGFLSPARAFSVSLSFSLCLSPQPTIDNVYILLAARQRGRTRAIHRRTVRDFFPARGLTCALPHRPRRRCCRCSSSSSTVVIVTTTYARYIANCLFHGGCSGLRFPRKVRYTVAARGGEKRPGARKRGNLVEREWDGATVRGR